MQRKNDSYLNLSKKQQDELIGEVLRTLRKEGGRSQAEMAEMLGVSDQTISRWESGKTGYNVFELIKWFYVLGLNPYPYFIKMLYPDDMNITNAKISDQEVDRSFDKLISTFTAKIKRAFLVLFYGKQHGSPLALTQLFLAYVNIPMRARVTIAKAIVSEYNMSKESGTLVCPENSQPDMIILNGAIEDAQRSVVAGKKGYMNLDGANLAESYRREKGTLQ